MNIKMGNDEFILYIRKQYPDCKKENDTLGRLIWLWIKKKDLNAFKTIEDLPCLWEAQENAKNVSSKMLPHTATQFEFDRKILPELYEHLDQISEKD